MPTNPDFKDLFATFNEESVEYLVVGAHAVAFYAEPRYTKDLDVWVKPSAENAGRVFEALKRFGAPLSDVTVADFTDPSLVFQMGVAPNRIDIMMGIAGLDFDSAWPNKRASTYGGIPIHVIGKDDLIGAKKASARPQDLLDLERLK